MQYTATAQHNGMTFTATGKNDHAAVNAAMQALRAVWNIDSHRATITVKLGEAVQYVTTAAKYQTATR
jgi:hypothetical protein